MASKNNQQLMLLGSMHMGKEDMYPLPEQVMTFLQQSDAVITEVDLTDQSQQAEPDLEHPEQYTKQILSAKQQAILKEISTELTLSDQVLLNLPAWQTAITLQVAQFKQMGFSQHLGVDSYITEQAKQLNKKIIGLESIAFQLELFNEPEISRTLLTDTIDNWQANADISRCLAKSWSAGNAKKLAEVAEISELDQEANQAFISDRNRDWADKLDSSFIGQGRYLVVVGALHLVGENSLIALLKSRGYSVTQLSKEKPVKCNLH